MDEPRVIRLPGIGGRIEGDELRRRTREVDDGPSAVKVRTPVATSARSVDWSAWVSPGVCPGGLPEAAQTQPSMIGWIVAEAVDAPLRKSAAAINIVRTKRLMVTPLREGDTQPHPGGTFIYQPAGPRVVLAGWPHFAARTAGGSWLHAPGSSSP